MFLAASVVHNGTIMVRYVLSDEPADELAAEYPEVVGETEAEFPTGLAELRGLMDAAAGGTSLLNHRPGRYTVRLRARVRSDEEDHLLNVSPTPTA